MHTQETLTKIYDILSDLDHTDLNFHAQRYESADKLQSVIIEIQSDQDYPVSLLESDIEQVLEYTKEDGGDYGTIPCLGGEPLEAWNRILRLWEMD